MIIELSTTNLLVVHMANGNEKFDIFKLARSAGCCKRCALRFIDYNEQIDYNAPDVYIQTMGYNTDDTIDCDGEQPPAVKKIKINPCNVCLDVLDDQVISDMLSDSRIDDILQYDADTFVNYISLPTAVLIRDHAIQIFLKQKHPNFFNELHNITPVNKAWTLSIQNKLAKIVEKKYDKNSVLLIQFNTAYDSDSQESEVVYKLDDKLRRPGKQGVSVSRNVVVELLKTVDSELFCKYVTVPPEIPAKAAFHSNLTVCHEPVFVAGRYCKYSRNLGQTPWIVDSVRVVENSVQEIIFKPFEDLFNYKTLVFSASGREDCDVRTLGRGRPFFIKIVDPKTTKIRFDQFRAIEREIAKSNLAEVKHLQLISKKDVSRIKDGEQFKKKIYRALCIVDQPDRLDSYIEKINDCACVTLQQKTPIRVFHRRSASSRTKEIHSMVARPATVNSSRKNLFELDLLTQAGTYVKEFVHGDCGRTTPSLGTIIGGTVDILALDVLDIQLDFPPPIIDLEEA